MACAAERHEEYQYLELVEQILRKADTRKDRTGTGTLSLFGTQSRYSLHDGKNMGRPKAKSNLKSRAS